MSYDSSIEAATQATWAVCGTAVLLGLIAACWHGCTKAEAAETERARLCLQHPGRAWVPVPKHNGGIAYECRIK